VRPVQNVFQKLSRTELSREGAVAYLWSKYSLRNISLCISLMEGVPRAFADPALSVSAYWVRITGIYLLTNAFPISRKGYPEHGGGQ
jgi:hypothetical protein